MKPDIVKIVLLVLTLIPFISNADESTIPSEKAKQNFARCVTSGNAWAACYHHLHPVNNRPDKNLDIAYSGPSSDYYAPRWFYTFLPTINPPDNRQKTSPWEATGKIIYNDTE